jgi:hypothetical protein
MLNGIELKPGEENFGMGMLEIYFNIDNGQLAIKIDSEKAGKYATQEEIEQIIQPLALRLYGNLLIQRSREDSNKSHIIVPQKKFFPLPKRN